METGSLFTSLTTETEMKAVEHLMSEICGTDVVGDICREHLGTGGKRLRARLALTITGLLGVKSEQGLGWAAACEMIHNATLIHDDLQDGDKVRRNHPTVWVRHGMKQAINSGDLLLMAPARGVEACPIPDHVKWLLAKTLFNGTEAAVRGQSLELELFALVGSDRLKPTYIKTIDLKTAALFKLPVQGAALIAQKDWEEAVEIADGFGFLGRLFQLQDDILDLYGKKGRETTGSDLQEGKISSLVVEHILRYPKDQNWLLEILEKPREATTQKEIKEVTDRFRQGGALEGVLGEIRNLKRATKEHSSFVKYPNLLPAAETLMEKILDPIRDLF